MKAAKALVALAVPLAGTVVLWWATGEFNQEEFIVLVTAFASGALTYFVPNKDAGTLPR